MTFFTAAETHIKGFIIRWRGEILKCCFSGLWLSTARLDSKLCVCVWLQWRWCWCRRAMWWRWRLLSSSAFTSWSVTSPQSSESPRTCFRSLWTVGFFLYFHKFFYRVALWRWRLVDIGVFTLLSCHMSVTSILTGSCFSYLSSSWEEFNLDIASVFFTWSSNCHLFPMMFGHQVAASCCLCGYRLMGQCVFRQSGGGTQESDGARRQASQLHPDGNELHWPKLPPTPPSSPPRARQHARCYHRPSWSRYEYTSCPYTQSASIRHENTKKSWVTSDLYKTARLHSK